jgi:hypothetical protein
MIVNRTDPSGESAHRNQINNLLSNELPVPSDYLSIIASSHDHRIVLNIDNLPYAVRVLLVRLSDRPAVPLHEIPVRRARHEHLILKREATRLKRGYALRAVQTLGASEVAALDGEELDVLEAHGRELSVVFPAGAEDLVRVHGRLADNAVVGPVVDGD